MERVELDVLDQTTNRSVVRMPTRRFPGLVIQGDTLSTLVVAAREIVEDLRAGGQPIEDAAYLADELDSMLRHYGRVLTAHGIKLPYVI